MPVDTNTNPPLLVLVDASSYLYRAFHSMPALSNAKGEPTGAIYGVLNMLRRLHKDYKSAEVIIVFDAKGKTFRHDLFKEYKATRPPMPEELRPQVEPLLDIITSLGYPMLIEPGVEADDVIGTIARQASAQNRDVLISTGDKDLAQLVDDHINLINTMTNTLLDSHGVLEKFGVKPQQIADYLALMGDSVDNIPGVEKVGPKTAAKWLQEYGSLNNILSNAEAIKGKIGENLRAASDRLPLSRQLTTIDCSVKLSTEFDNWHQKPRDVDALKKWFERFEFKTWLAELSDTESLTPAAQSIETHYETITSRESFEQWLKRLQQAPLFSFDTETTSLNYMQAKLVGISFSVSAHEAAYVPLGHSYDEALEQLPIEYVLEHLKPLLENTEQAKIIGQHLKYDRNVLLGYGIQLNAIAHDTMLQSYVLDSTATRHDMDSLAKKYLGMDTVHFEDIAGKGAKQLSFDQIDIVQAAHYAAEDADITLQLHQTLWPKLQQTPSLEQVYHDIELPLAKILSKIEYNGVAIDADLLNRLSERFAKQMLEIEAEAYADAGSEFNLNSPKQIQAILFEQQGLPVIRKTPKGQPSTAEDVLQELADRGHNLPQLIVQHRGLSKLKSTYTDKLPGQIDSRTNRIHTSYHQAIASTGRLSSADPNLQNIPIRSENGRQIRKAFIAPPGKKLIAADYSQIELRIMAHLSGDTSLITAFEKGIDVHRATAGEVFGVAPEDVSADQRRAAKAINFGLIYGMSAFGLAKQLSISRSEAQAYINLYFEHYPGVKEYMDSTRERARKQGYVETVFGRRLYLPDINSRNAAQRQYAERTAINAPMQGTAADIIKRAMIAVDSNLSANYPEVLLIMQVHDELVFEVPETQLDIVQTAIRQCMTAAAEISVALVVDIGVGDNWDEAH